PAHYLGRAALPMCWVSGTNDFAFPLSALKRSYQLPAGPRTLCLRIEMPHSHVDGWAPAEIGVFMDSLLLGGAPLPRLHDHGTDGRAVWARCDAPLPITHAELCCTRALGHWADRKWQSYPAQYDADAGCLTATLPPRATVWFLNVYDERGCVASTPHAEIGNA
ncbi:MAG TPA: dipeptidyl aminopeptidase, partial [Armatimonadota bacterium]|nr:dipeptidyl aminopeptidase [Armatimonadota bacterium]